MQGPEQLPLRIGCRLRPHFTMITRIDSFKISCRGRFLKLLLLTTISREDLRSGSARQGRSRIPVCIRDFDPANLPRRPVRKLSRLRLLRNELREASLRAALLGVDLLRDALDSVMLVRVLFFWLGRRCVNHYGLEGFFDEVDALLGLILTWRTLSLGQLLAQVLIIAE